MARSARHGIAVTIDALSNLYESGLPATTAKVARAATANGYVMVIAHAAE
jgi:hypothetical protein